MSLFTIFLTVSLFWSLQHQFAWILPNFQKQLFQETPFSGCFPTFHYIWKNSNFQDPHFMVQFLAGILT